MNRIPPKSPGNEINRRISINSLGSRPNSQAGFRNRLTEGTTFRKFSVLAHSKRQSTTNDVTITQIEPDTSKDTRPLNRKSYQTQCIGELISYLKSQNYMVDIQRKDLNPASNKDFQDIFKFLYSKIDSNFVFKRRFEEEVPNLLTQLMYPNANNINKSHLSTVGTQHKWPTLLGVLHWLMKLAQAEESIDEAQEGENTVNYDDPAFNDIAYCQYAQHRFSSTLQGVSDSEALENAEQVLHNLLDQKFDIYDHENQQFEAEIEGLSDQLEKEKEKPNLKGCLDQLNIEKERAEQFLSYLQKNNEYKQRYLEDENNRNLEYEKLESEIGELKEIVASLEETIDNQELTQAEIHHLINERINLLTELEQIKMKYRASESELEQLEEERRIRANDVLVELNRYNQLLEECGLVDNNHERIQVALDPLAEQRTSMLNYELISSVEPNLINLINTFEQAQISTKTQTVKLQTDIQSIQVELEELEFQKDQCKVEVNQKDEEFREEKFKFESQSKALQDQINLIHMKIKKYNPKTKSDVLNAKGELNRIKTDVSKLQRDLDFQLEHLINSFKSSQSQLTEEFNKVFENLNNLEDKAKDELEFTERQAHNINQTEDEFGEFALITPYKKRRIDL